MSQRLKEWAFEQPEFQAFEQQIESGQYDGPRGSIRSLESQLPKARKMREEIERERNRD